MSNEVPKFRPLEITLVTRFFQASLFENAEYAFLNEEFYSDRQGVHCEDCNHHHQSHGVAIVIFVIFSLVVFFVYSLLLYAGNVESISQSTQASLKILLSFLTSVGLISILLIVNNKVRFMRRRNAPPFPVVGRTPAVEIKESLIATVKLNEEGTYFESIEKRQGELNYTVRISSTDGRRYDEYKKNFNIHRIGRHQYHGGFLLFKSNNSIKFNRLKTDHTNVLQLKTTSISPLFESFAETNQWKWEVEDKYQIVPNEKILTSLPIQIIPNIISEVNKPRALEIRILVDRTLYLSQGNIAPLIQEMRLRCPIALKNVRRTDPPILLERNRLNELDLVWGNIPLKQGESDENVFLRTFHVLFNEAVEPSTKFHGRLKLLLNGNISGLHGFRFFYPTGNERLAEECKVYNHTEIIINFDMVLQKANLSRPYHNTLISIEKHIIPNHTNINILVNKLSRNGAYIQRVIENPPYTNISNAKVHNRYWDIAGRYYLGVFSVDFHLLVTGHEQFEDRDSAQNGVCTFDVNVQAIIIDDEESLAEVCRIENEIKEIINNLDAQTGSFT